jgi:hypothetical protein
MRCDTCVDAHVLHWLIRLAVAFITGTDLPVSHSSDGKETMEVGDRHVAAAESP